MLFIMRKAMPAFNYVFRKYDDLNASVQENISGIRVVKAFVREDYENKKFTKAAENIYRLFVKAEKIVIFNSASHDVYHLRLYDLLIMVWSTLHRWWYV